MPGRAGLFWKPVRLGLIAVLFNGAGLAYAQEAPTDSLRKIGPFPTVEASRLFIVGSDPAVQSQIVVGGMAVDRQGNVYLSEIGSGAGTGSIIMIPKDATSLGRPIRIIRGLTTPRDIELTPDQRAVVVSESDGARISRHPFGITVINANVDVPDENLIVYAKTDLGPKKAPGRSPDGLYHIPGILVPGQVSTKVDIVVQGTTLTRAYRARVLGQPGETGPPFGQTIVDLGF